ncbi:unnamed protein product [Effrenium voratum]|nr:unnamed protein product [Effrenium voratum]
MAACGEVELDASPTASSSTSTRPPGGTKWVDEFACSALCQLILDDRSCGVCERRRRALPPFLYVEAIAPYLRFEELLPNMLYAFGGRNQEQGPLDTVEVFNTWHGRWVPGPSMPKRRAGSAAAVLDDGRMMIIGGYTEQGIAQGLLASCDVFDPATEQWTEDGAAPLSRARWGHGCACLQGKVYVVGGCSLQLEAQAQEAFMVTLRHCEIYLPKENRWIATAPLQIARSGTRVVALDDSHLAAIGGCDDVFGRAETQPTVELFDARTQVWSVLEHRLSFPRTVALPPFRGVSDGMEAHLGADLLQELQPPCLLSSIGKTMPYSGKFTKTDEMGLDLSSSASTASEVQKFPALWDETPTCSLSSFTDSPRRAWRDLSPMKLP